MTARQLVTLAVAAALLPACLGAAAASEQQVGAAVAPGASSGSRAQVRVLAKHTTPPASWGAKHVRGIVRAIQPTTALPAPAAVREKLARAKKDRGAARAVADAHRAELATAFGANVDQMVPTESEITLTGSSTVFQQVVDGVPVYGGEVNAVVDNSGALESAIGEVTLSTLGTFPAAPPAAASASAKEYVAINSKGSPTSVTLVGPRWFDSSLLSRSLPTPAIPTYLYSVSTGDGQKWQVFTTTTGEALGGFDTIETLNRTICDNAEQIRSGTDEQIIAAIKCGANQSLTPARVEGQADTGTADVDQVYNYFGDTAKFYQNLGYDLTDGIGVDYGDGLGKGLRGTTRLCIDTCPYPNAFWDGTQMAFGTGVTNDDITGHELTHGVTQHHSNLVYLGESGAINESLSDIFGEFVDLTNNSTDDTPANRWLIGEGSSLGVIRSMKNPPAHNQPDRMRSPLWKNDQIPLDNGGVHTFSGVGNKAAYLLTDGDTFNTVPVAGVGLADSKRIWWAASQRLTSGSDYGDLANALRAGCASLVKVGQVTKKACTSVTATIAATDLDKTALTAPDPAPICDPKQKVNSTLWSSSFATGTNYGDWTPSASGQGSLGKFTQDGDEAAFSGFAPGTHILPLGEVTVPKKKGSTYLRLTHAWQGTFWFIFAIQIGIQNIEYSTDNGATWVGAEILPGINGPTPWMQVDTQVAGFVGDSYSYTTSRIDLTSLAGRKIKLRAKAVTGLPTAWWIDNAQVYTCK
ncbi:M4 family metallopeptidase [Streptomyces chartreusis]